MPPLIHCALGWLVGLAVGASATSSAWLTSAAVIIVVVVAAVTVWLACSDLDPRARWSRVVAVAALTGSGIVHARVSGAADRACRTAIVAALSRGDAVRAVFDERAAPKQVRRGAASGKEALRRCRVDLSARIDSGRADAGQWVMMHGQALATERGVRAEVVLTRSSSHESDWRRAARGRAATVIDRDFGTNAPLVRALLIADQAGIPPAVRDVFADAGLVHLLSISGLHVAIIAGALLTVAGALRLSRTMAFGAALIVITLYVAAIGAPAPAVRSAVMLAVVGLSERLQRPVHPWTALALGAVIPTAQADVVLDLGWQLSVGGMAALVAARALWRRLRHERLRVSGRAKRLLARFRRLDGWRASLARELLTGTIATVVTAPLIAWTFGRISLIAPLSNLAAGPLVVFIQPALFLALVTSPWPVLSHTVALATALPLRLLDWVARAAAAVPYASVHVAPTALSALCAAVASMAFVRATASRSWTRGVLMAALALALAVWAPLLAPGSGRLEVHVLDVGQGDAIAIRTPRGRWVLVDAGRRWDGGDAGRRVVIPYVRRYGGDVAAFVMSHAHDDHVGGAATIVNALNPQRWWEPAFVTRSEAYRRALAAVQGTHARWRRVQPGDAWHLDGAEIRVLAPDSSWTAAQQDANETSVVLRVSYGQVAFLLTGDAEQNEEAWMLAHVDPQWLAADVLKLGHHGSKTSSSEPFLDAVSPRLGVVSVGAGNTYGHPSPSTLQHFAERHIPIIRTDLEQTIVVSTDGHRIDVNAGSSVWTLPPRK